MYQRFAQRERGQGLVEYALILSLVAIVVIVILAVFGDSITSSYRCIVITMENLGNSPISGIALVDSSTDQDINWVCGQNLSLADMPANVTFRTYASVVGSMEMILNGPVSNTRTEYIPPYSLWGDNNGDFAGQALVAGDYTLTTIAYSDSGTEIGRISIDFRVQA